jgi:hypothetical protein
MSIDNLMSKYSKYIQKNTELYIPIEEINQFVDSCNDEDLLIGGYEVLGLWEKATQDCALYYSVKCTDESDWERSKKESHDGAILVMKLAEEHLGNKFSRSIMLGVGKYIGHIFCPSLWDKEQWRKQHPKNT